MKDRRGLTLLEVIIVMSIAAIMYVLSLAIYRNWSENIVLLNKSEELKSALIRAQQLAMTAAANSSWGLHVATSSYTLFPGEFYDENNPDNKTWLLENIAILNSNTAFFDGLSSYGPDVIFAKFTGQTANTGTVTMFPISKPTVIKNIIVQSSGQVY